MQWDWSKIFQLTSTDYGSFSNPTAGTWILGSQRYIPLDMEEIRKLYLTIWKEKCQKPRKSLAVAINMSAEELTASFNLNLDFRRDVSESGGDILSV